MIKQRTTSKETKENDVAVAYKTKAAYERDSDQASLVLLKKAVEIYEYK